VPVTTPIRTLMPECIEAAFQRVMDRKTLPGMGTAV